MEQVWKCGFCSHTHKEKETMEKHETTCFLNPKNKECYTCANEKEECWNSVCNSHCGKGFEFGEDYKTCNEWVVKL